MKEGDVVAELDRSSVASKVAEVSLAALTQFVQALRGYWIAHYALRRLTLYDFESDTLIR